MGQLSREKASASPAPHFTNDDEGVEVSPANPGISKSQCSNRLVASWPLSEQTDSAWGVQLVLFHVWKTWEFAKTIPLELDDESLTNTGGIPSR